MLVIRKEQMAVLEEHSMQGFERELVEHIKGFAAKHSEVIGDEAVRDVVRLGIERAKTYGFTNKGPVRYYVELMCMFGSDFDTDPQLPWSDGVLNNYSIKDQMERADILHEEMVEYLEEVAGPDKQNLFEAMRRFGRARIADYRRPGEDFDIAVKALLANSYPQKTKYLGNEGLSKLTGRGKELAQSYSITSDAGITLLIGLMLSFGHGVAKDRLYPWVSQTLEDESIGDPNERAKRLRSRVKAYLEQTLKNLGQEKADGAV